MEGIDVSSLPPRERIEAYIINVEKAIEKIKGRVSGEYLRLVKLAEAYVSDARFYLEKGDTFTALATVAYAEGLLDALRWLGVVEFEWDSTVRIALRPKVLVAGTFDILHPGHIALLRYAWGKGRVYVIVARDESVEKFKGRPPLIPEQQRLEVVSSVRYVYKAMLGSKRDVLEPIVAVKPDIIVLGPDQWADEEWLQKRLEERGLNVRVERFPERVSCPLCSSTSIICKAARLGREICEG